MPRRIFISYTHKEPDESLATKFSATLNQAGDETFLSSKKNMSIEDWDSTIKKQLTNCDCFIVILSERSLMNELITEEIRIATELLKDGKRIIIFPVRIKLPLHITLNYDIKEYLKPVKQRLWSSESDTQILIEKLFELLKSGNNEYNQDKESEIVPTPQEERYNALPAPNAPLEIPGGNIRIASKYYIERPGEKEFIQTITNTGALLRIKGPRQYGKTSLLSRIIYYAKEQDHTVVPFSFQQITTKQIQNLDNLLLQLCLHTTRKTGLPNRVKEFWDDEFMDIKMKCNAYFEEYLLVESKKPILLALDEADKLFEYQDVSNDFFSMLRVWHEQRNINPLWERLKMAVSHSTEAYLAISKMNQSPFNVGNEKELKEFDVEQVADFALRHQIDFNSQQIEQLMNMVGGHPYLIHRALYEIASGNYNFAELIKNAPSDDGPFSDHLRRHFWNLTQLGATRQVMKEILQKGTSDDVLTCSKLRAAGLIKGGIPAVVPSFKLYEEYFRNKL